MIIEFVGGPLDGKLISSPTPLAIYEYPTSWRNERGERGWLRYTYRPGDDPRKLELVETVCYILDNPPE